MRTAPVALFAYNRPDHTRQTIEALARNELAAESELFIFSDAAKKPSAEEGVRGVRELVRSVEGFRSVTVIERETNWGLAKSIIGGVTDLLCKHGRVIVLEDDLMTSPYYLRFMNEGLAFYENRPQVFTVCGCSHPPAVFPMPPDYDLDVYFSYRNFSTGWGTWLDRWTKADWAVSDYEAFRKSRADRRAFARGGGDLPWMLDDQMNGLIDSWSIRWTYSQYRHNAYAVCPVFSHIANIGFDGTGTHSRDANVYDNDLSLAKASWTFPDEVRIDERVMASLRRLRRPAFKHRMKRMLMAMRLVDGKRRG